MDCYKGHALEVAFKVNEIPYCAEENCKDRVIPPPAMKKLLSKKDFTKYEYVLMN